MRGEDFFAGEGKAHVSRFTPTCVGKTAEGLQAPPEQAVHPHMRGEDAA